MKIKLLILSLIFTNLFCFGQNTPATLKEITPVSPEASAIQRAGNWPVGHSTGLPNINIPLFDIKSGQMPISVSLSYHAGGMRVNDEGPSVGMGWNLAAGGVISRTIMGGQPDDRMVFGFWDSYPIDENLTNDAYGEIARMQQYASGLYDSQPDVFNYSFSGSSGKFLFDHHKNIAKIPFNNLLINPSFYGPSAVNPYTLGGVGNALMKFSITTPEGIQYIFSEPEYSKTTVKTYEKSTGLEILPDIGSTVQQEEKEAFTKTWYLAYTVSADKKDTIRYHYNAYEIDFKTPGSSSSSFSAQFEGNIPKQRNGINTRSVVHNKIQHKSLSRIDFRNGSILFYENTARRDLNGGKVLDSIALFDSGSKRIKSYHLSHKYLKDTSFLTTEELGGHEQADSIRLFLIGIQEIGSDGASLPAYKFEYEHSLVVQNKNIEGGDYWGMSNGKVWNYIGDSLVFPSSVGDLEKYNAFTDDWVANLKAPIFNYAKQGSIKEIIYPSGGRTSFTFEPHASTGQEYIQIPVERCDGGGATITNADFINQAVVGKFYVTPPVSSLAVVDIFFRLGVNYADFPSYYSVQIIDSATNNVIHTFSYNPMEPSITCDSYTDVPYPKCRMRFGMQPGTYLIKAKNSGQHYQSVFPPEELVFCNIDVPAFNCKIDMVNHSDSLVSGGLRIKEIKDIDPIAGKKVTRRFEYAQPFRPSGLGVFQSEVEHYYCGTHVTAGIIQTPLYSFEKEKAISSSSSYNLIDLNGGFVKYGLVKEEIYDSTLGSMGFSVYKFNVDFDDPDFASYRLLPYPPFTGNSWMVGQLESKADWKIENGVDKLVRDEKTYYSVAHAKRKVWGQALFHFNVDHFGEYVNAPVTGQLLPCSTRLVQPGFSEYQSQYNVKRQPFYYTSNYNTVDSVVVRDFDDSDKEVRSITRFYYDTTNIQLQQTVKSNSGGGYNITRFFYPSSFADLTGLDDASLGLQYLKSNNIIAPLVSSTTYKSVDGIGLGKIISSSVISFQPNAPYPSSIKEYDVSASNFAGPSIVEGSFTFDQAYKSKVHFEKYDDRGNIEQQRLEGNFSNAYIWGHNKDLLIAEVLNAEVTKIAYTSFEDQDLGGWSLVSGSVYVNNNSISGKRSLSGGVSKTLPLGNYVLSFWSEASTWVNGAVFTDQPVKNLGNGRRYFEKILTNVTSVQVSGDNIDEVRIYPIGAHMSTYTYDPLIGMTSHVDAAGNITYYEYDSFGRLSMVRDEKRNIIKRICYNYAGQPEPCRLYGNQLKSQIFTRNNCLSGATPGTYTYSVAANQYFAESQLAADALAQADINANGQSAANANAVCTYGNVIKSGTFTRNNCSLGEFGSTVTYTVAANTYTSTVSQAAADALAQADVDANGQAYANTNGTCAVACIPRNCRFEGQKCVNNNCEWGVKVYTSAVQNPSTLMWTCTYHYEFSDGSWSMDYSEVSARQCDIPL